MRIEQDAIQIQYDRKRKADKVLDVEPGAANLNNNRLYNDEDSSKWIYLDTGGGSDSNSGLTEGLPKLTYAAAAALVDGNNYTTVQVINDGVTLDGTINKPVQMKRGELGAIEGDYSVLAGTWTQAATPSFGGGVDIHGVVWASKLGIAVAVGVGEIAYSSDGDTWTQAATPSFGADVILCVTFSEDKGIFVAGGENSKLAYSTDGDTWTQASVHPFNNDVSGVTYSESLGIFVAVGDVYPIPIAYSTDGNNWVLASQSPFVSYNDVVWAESLGIFVAVGNGQIAYSTDGDVWIASSTPSFSGTNIRAVTWSEDKGFFVAVGDSGKIARSSDGDVWTQGTTPFGASVVYGVTYAIDLAGFVAVGASGKIAYSESGIGFNLAGTPSFGATEVLDVTFASELGRFIAVGNSAKIARSSLPTNIISADIAGFEVTYSRFTGSMTAKSCNMNSFTTDGNLSMTSCMANNVRIQSNNFLLNSNLIYKDVNIHCTPTTQNAVNLTLNTIAGVLNIHNSSQTLFERIRENLIVGGVQADFNVFVEGGNINPSATNINALLGEYVTRSDPKFVDTTDYKLQFQSDGYLANSLAVARSRFYLNSNGDKRDIGAWSYIETNIRYEYALTGWIVKGDITHGKTMSVNEQQGDNGPVSVYINQSRTKEVLTIVYNSVQWDEIRPIIDYIETLDDMGVKLLIDPDISQGAGTVQADGGQSIGDTYIDIDSQALFNGMTLTIDGNIYYMMYATPSIDAATRIVLNKPLITAIADNDVINTNLPEGAGEYQYSPNENRQLTRNEKSTLSGWRQGLVLRFVRQYQ